MTVHDKVKDIKVGEKSHGFYLIKSMEKQQTVKKTDYYDVWLQDATGEVLAKVWEAELIKNEKELLDNRIVYVVGMGAEWDGKIQLKVSQIKTVPKGQKELSEFIKSAPISIDEMFTELIEFGKKIEDTDIRSVVGGAVTLRQDDLKTYPAAKGMHHAIYGGLLFHELSMLRLAESLLPMYPFLNKDLVYAGIILHDIEKTTETNADHGSVTEYTRGGKLLGHLVQGVMLIEQMAAKYNTPQDTKEALQHLVVSHHDKAEWGSPKQPQMPEAVFLHFLDNLDAKMYMVREAVENANGEWTDKVYGLGNVQLYLYRKNDEV
jgi:3'-5' exoribonuclease